MRGPTRPLALLPPPRPSGGHVLARQLCLPGGWVLVVSWEPLYPAPTSHVRVHSSHCLRPHWLESDDGVEQWGQGVSWYGDLQRSEEGRARQRESCPTAYCPGQLILRGALYPGWPFRVPTVRKGVGPLNTYTGQSRVTATSCSPARSADGGSPFQQLGLRERRAQIRVPEKALGPAASCLLHHGSNVPLRGESASIAQKAPNALCSLCPSPRNQEKAVALVCITTDHFWEL